MFASSPRPRLPEALVAAVRPVALAQTRTFPLVEPWNDLIPGGSLRRGGTVAVVAPPGSGGLSLSLGLLSAASAESHWAAVVGVDDPGVVAIADLGLDLRRTLFVPRPGGAWAEATADLLEGVDLVLVRPPTRVSTRSARTLGDRVRERGAAMIVLGAPRAPWPSPTDLSLEVVASRWHAGSRLEGRTLRVRITGRGGVRPVEREVALPDRRGRAAAS